MHHWLFLVSSLSNGYQLPEWSSPFTGPLFLVVIDIGIPEYSAPHNLKTKTQYDDSLCFLILVGSDPHRSEQTNTHHLSYRYPTCYCDS